MSRTPIGLVALLMASTQLPLIVSLTTQADAHCYSIWRYNFPQHCPAKVAQAPIPVPTTPIYLQDEVSDIPLPSLEGMAFPPDCAADWCGRLKGVGLLRDKLGTN